MDFFMSLKLRDTALESSSSNCQREKSRKALEDGLGFLCGAQLYMFGFRMSVKIGKNKKSLPTSPLQTLL